MGKYRRKLQYFAVVLVSAGFLLGAVACGAMAQTAAVPGENVHWMAADADPSFEVATIRPSDPDHPLEEARLRTEVCSLG